MTKKKPPAPKPTPGPTRPRQLRLTDAELTAIERLGSRWGPVKPLTRTDVVREAIRRAYVTEFGSEP